MSYRTAEQPLDPEEYEIRMLGKKPKTLEQLEREDEAIEQRNQEECEAMIQGVLGFTRTNGTEESGDSKLLAEREYATGYSDLYLTPAMLDAVVENDAIRLMQLVRKEIVSNIKHDFLGVK